MTNLAMNVLYHLSMFWDRKQILLSLVSFLAIHRNYVTNQRQSGEGLFEKSSRVHNNIAVYETLTSSIYSQVPYNVHQFADHHKYTCSKNVLFQCVHVQNRCRRCVKQQGTEVYSNC